MNRKNQYSSALYAGIVGDALGVPVEFSTRQELALCSVKNMIGYGRYDEPEGTWSDDTSLTLCTLESLQRGYDVQDLGMTFCQWLFKSHWTPSGYVFDSGLTTFMALDRLQNEGISALVSGGCSDDDCGNGSLMRILPAALYFSPLAVEPFLQRIHEVSAITHAHPRTLIGCGIYALLVRELLNEKDKQNAYRSSVNQALAYYSGLDPFHDQLHHFGRVLSFAIPSLEEDSIGSSGYIIDTLEASLWCFLRYANTQEILLAAVNLGLDTDTTGMVAGGLAGSFYGIDSIPQSWLEALARKKEIDGLISQFVDAAVAFQDSTTA